MNNPNHLEERLQISTVNMVIPLPPENLQRPTGEINPIDMFNQQNSVENLMNDDPMYTKLDKGWRYIESTSEVNQYTAKLSKDRNRISFYGSSDGRKGSSCDSFELMKIQKGLDQKEAVIFAAKNTKINPSNPNSVTVDQHNKSLHFQVDAQAAFAKAGIDNISTSKASPTQSPLARLRALSTTNRLDEMIKNMRNEIFIIMGLVLSGQITLFFGKPNSGKTLFVLRWLINAVKSGLLKGENIFYLNADDNYKGLFTKTKIANQFNISMISPAESGTSTDEILALLGSIADSDEAKDMVIIIDTVKKFTNVMHKGKQNEFFTGLRRVVAKGGTVILLGHANKHSDADGNLIYEGTSDILNDIDAAYSLNIIERDDIKTIIEFRCEKSRGNNIQRVSYGYNKTEGGSYQDLLNSVYALDDVAVTTSHEEMNKRKILEQYALVLPFFNEVLKNHSLNQSEIMSMHGYGEFEFSKRQLSKSLTALDGIHLKSSKDFSGNNSTNYSLINHYPAPPKPQQAKDG